VRKPVGRRPVTKEIRELIFKMVAESPTWRAPRIHGELARVSPVIEGIVVVPAHVAARMGGLTCRLGKTGSPSQSESAPLLVVI
jgi:hypothetical protein